MKNKFNFLVIFLMLVCFLDAGYRIYRTYQRLHEKDSEMNRKTKVYAK
jgi:hypothetical protein